MIEWIRYYIWFIKESQSFMQGYNPAKVFFQSLYKGISFASELCAWDKLSNGQKKAWYLSGEGRTMEIGRF